MTQQELSNTSGIERSAIAKIERGGRGISALELASIARALDARFEWFLSDGPEALASHRVRAGTEATLSTIDRELERLARDVELLASMDRTLLAGAVDPVEPVTSAQEAVDLARHARGLCGLDSIEPANDLVDITAEIGLLGFAIPLGGDTADAATTLLERGAVALVNSTHSVGRRRLALAHELGHYLIADDYSVDWRVAEPSSSDRTEALLDRFARAFLAPDDGLTQLWTSTREIHGVRTSAVITASHFKIDMSTLARRLSELGLTSPDETASIRRVKTTKSDIIELGLLVAYDLDEVALPRSYTRSVLALYREERVSAERALSLLGGTFDLQDLPPLRPAHPDELWSVVS